MLPNQLVNKIYSKYDFIERSCWILLTFSLLEAIGGGLVFYLAYFFKVAVGFGNFQIGKLGFVAGLGALFGSSIGALISDKIQPKSVLITGFLISGASFYLLAYKLSFLANLPIVFALGTCSSVIMNTNTLMLIKLSPSNEKHLRVIQNLRVVYENTGCGLAMLLIMFCSGNYYAQVFSCLGAFFVLLALTSLRYLAPVDIKKNSSGEVKASNVKSKKFNLEQFTRAISSVFLIGLIFGFQKITYPLAMHSYFKSTLLIGMLFAMDPLFVSCFSLKINSYFSSFSSRTTMAIGAAFLSIGLICLANSTALIMVVISTLIFLIGEVLFMPSSQVYTNESVSTDREGFAVSFKRLSWNIGTMLGAWAAGYILESNTFFTSWRISSSLGLVTLILLFIPSLRGSWVIQRYGNAASK